MSGSKIKLKEMKCGCGCDGHEVKMDRLFMSMIRDARSMVNIPFVIASGYRCPLYNKSVGGKTKSAHLKGKAADIVCQDNEARIIMVQALLDAGFERIGVGKTFIHADCDLSLPYPRMWTYY